MHQPIISLNGCGVHDWVGRLQVSGPADLDGS